MVEAFTRGLLGECLDAAINGGNNLSALEEASLRLPLPPILDLLLADRHHCRVHHRETGATLEVIRRESAWRIALSCPAENMDCLIEIDGAGRISGYESRSHAPVDEAIRIATGREAEGSSLTDALTRTLFKLITDKTAERCYPRFPAAVLAEQERLAAGVALTLWEAWASSWKQKGLKDPPPEPFPPQVIAALRPLFLANGINLVPMQSVHETTGGCHRLEVIRPGASRFACIVTNFEKRYQNWALFLAPETLAREKGVCVFDARAGIGLGLEDVRHLLNNEDPPFPHLNHELCHARQFQLDFNLGRPGLFSGYQKHFCRSRAKGYERRMSFDEVISFAASLACTVGMLSRRGTFETLDRLRGDAANLEEVSAVVHESTLFALKVRKFRGVPMFENRVIYGNLFLDNNKELVVTFPESIIDCSLPSPSNPARYLFARRQLDRQLYKLTKERVRKLNEAAETILLKAGAIIAMVDRAKKTDPNAELPEEVWRPIQGKAKELNRWIMEKHNAYS